MTYRVASVALMLWAAGSAAAAGPMMRPTVVRPQIGTPDYFFPRNFYRMGFRPTVVRPQIGTSLFMPSPTRMGFYSPVTRPGIGTPSPFPSQAHFNALASNPYAAPQLFSPQFTGSMLFPTYPAMYSDGGYGGGGYGGGGYGGGGYGAPMPSSSAYPDVRVRMAAQPEERINTFDALGLSNRGGHLDWPVALRILPPGGETRALRRQIEALLEAATNEPAGHVNPRTLAGASHAVNELRAHLAELAARERVAPNSASEAQRFLDKIEGALAQLGADY